MDNVPKVNVECITSLQLHIIMHKNYTVTRDVKLGKASSLNSNSMTWRYYSALLFWPKGVKCNANSRPSQHKGWHQIPPPKFVDKSRLSIFQVITEITDVRWNYHCAACPWRGTFGLYFLNTEFVVILSKDSSNSIISWYCCLIKTRDISSKTKLKKICMVQK